MKGVVGVGGVGEVELETGGASYGGVCRGPVVALLGESLDKHFVIQMSIFLSVCISVYHPRLRI